MIINLLSRSSKLLIIDVFKNEIINSRRMTRGRAYLCVCTYIDTNADTI